MKSFTIIATAVTAVAAKANFDFRAVPAPGKLMNWRRAGNGTTTNPSSIDGFELLGCFTDTALTVAKTDSQMTLELCASSCSGTYFGVATQDCYCGTSLGSSAQQVPASQCSAPCPGNPSETCGGAAPASMKRQAASPPLTVYRRAGGDQTSSSTPGSSSTPTGSGTATGSSVAPTSTANPQNVVCYGDHCCPELACATCPQYRVVCQDGRCAPEQCAADQANTLVICQGAQCTYSKCSGDQCNRQITCAGGQCSVVTNVPCQNLVCRDGNCKFEACAGNACNQQVECKGNNCNAKPTPAGPAPPPAGPPAQAPPAQAPPAQGPPAQGPPAQGPPAQAPPAQAPPAQAPPAGQAPPAAPPAQVPPQAPAGSAPPSVVASMAGKLEATLTLFAAAAGFFLTL